MDAMPVSTIHGLLEQKVRERGNDPFLFFGDDVFGYRELDSRAARVAVGLQRLGVRRGDKVALMLGNRPEFLFFWFGLSKIGAVEVPLNTAHRGDVLAHMLGLSESRLLVIEESLVEQAAPVLSGLPKLERIVLLDGERRELSGKPVVRFETLTDNAGDFEPVEVGWSDPFAIMFTSGTTGPSKGALMPHNYGLGLGTMLRDWMRYDETDRLYCALPLFHGNAQVLSTLPALASGASLVLARRFSASGFWEDVRRFGCTEFNYIGGIISILMKAEPRADDADNPLRTMFGAGAPAALRRAFEKRFGLTLVEGYGMSEIGMPLMTPEGEGPDATCGKVHPHYEARLVDDDERDVPPNVPGELLVRPRHPYSMQLEYYRMPEKTVEAWRNLWFHTGDYLQRDEAGWFSFLDRKKDAIRRRGENVSSFEVETGVNAHEAVLESAAISVPSPLGEDEVMVCVVLKPGCSLSAEALIAHCEARMAYFMVPRYVRFMRELPKTPTERVQKYRLRAEGVTSDTWDRSGGRQGKR